jgi:hypothetical protein
MSFKNTVDDTLSASSIGNQKTTLVEELKTNLSMIVATGHI